MSLLESFIEQHCTEEQCQGLRDELSSEGLWLGEQLVGRMDEATAKPLSDAYQLIDYHLEKGKIQASEVPHLRIVAKKVHEILTT